MKPATLVVDRPYQSNRIFDRGNTSLNRDECLYAFSALKSELREHGFDLQTQDRHSIESAALVIYNERPSILPPANQKAKSMLLLFESELIRPDNWDREAHQRFQQIFTWNDTWVDGRHYFKGGFSHLFPPAVSRRPVAQRKLCTLIAGNKSVSHPLELYSHRRKAIRWFETHAPSEFEYYGVGWERPYLKGGFTTKVCRKLGLLEHLPVRPSRCYRGQVESKLATLENYRFSICFENAQGIPGYITEKLFDSLFAGCIPIYWGAANILEFVDANCLIDFRQFKDWQELYRFLKAMEPAEFGRRWNAIDAYLQSPKSLIFNADAWARSVVATMLAAPLFADARTTRAAEVPS